jgi:hypothetical protein
MLNLLAYRYATSLAWGKVKELLQNSFSDSHLTFRNQHDHPAEPNTKEDKHRIKEVQEIPIPSFQKTPV